MKRFFCFLIVAGWGALFGCGGSPGGDVAAPDVITEDPGPVASDKGPSPSDVALPPLDANAPTEGIRYAFMTVHMEPGNSPVDLVTGGINFDRPKMYFKDMVALVQAADTHDHKLTLMFNPQWAAYFVDSTCVLPPDTSSGAGFTYAGTEYTDCLSLIRAIEAQGHELALHHHPLTAPSTWDGFTNEESWTADRDGQPGEETYYADGSGPAGPDPYYLGDLNDLMAWLDQLPAAGPGHIVTATTEEFPESIRYLSSGGPQSYSGVDEPGDLVSRPCATVLGGKDLWQVRMRLFTSAITQNKVMNVELPAAIADHKAQSGPYAVGFVTHAKNVSGNGTEPYTKLFEQLSSAGLKLERVRDVMAHYSYTEGEPANASSLSACP